MAFPKSSSLQLTKTSDIKSTDFAQHRRQVSQVLLEVIYTAAMSAIAVRDVLRLISDTTSR